MIVRRLGRRWGEHGAQCKTLIIGLLSCLYGVKMRGVMGLTSSRLGDYVAQ